MLCLMLMVVIWAKAQDRNWQTGTLSKSEHMKVREGSTETTTIDGYLNDSRNSYSASNISTTNTTNDYETYQELTIEFGQVIYVVREHLLYAWSKPNVSAVGEPIKFTVEKDTLYLIGIDGRQHKTAIVKVKFKRTPVDQNWQRRTPS